MILITGSGRSGTTFLTRLFKELGFLLLPECMDEIDKSMGLEGRAWDISKKLCALRGFSSVDLARKSKWFWHGLMTTVSKFSGLGSQRMKNLKDRAPRWTDIPDELKNQLRDLQAEVIKSPHALRVLDLWLNARQDIDLVIFCIRDLKVVAKRWKILTGMKERDSIQQMHESYGMAFLSLHSLERKVPHVVISFPESANNVEYLFDKLDIPLKELGKPIDRSDFFQAYRKIVKPDWIHD